MFCPGKIFDDGTAFLLRRLEEHYTFWGSGVDGEIVWFSPYTAEVIVTEDYGVICPIILVRNV